MRECVKVLIKQYFNYYDLNHTVFNYTLIEKKKKPFSGVRNRIKTGKIIIMDKPKMRLVFFVPKFAQKFVIFKNLNGSYICIWIYILCIVFPKNTNVFNFISSVFGLFKSFKFFVFYCFAFFALPNIRMYLFKLLHCFPEDMHVLSFYLNCFFQKTKSAFSFRFSVLVFQNL